MATNYEQTRRQIVDRYNAKKAIFEAMTRGRRISLMDSMEFRVSEMHTTICNIRQEIERKNLPWELKDRWVCPYGKKFKEYWLESRKSC